MLNPLVHITSVIIMYYSRMEHVAYISYMKCSCLSKRYVYIQGLSTVKAASLPPITEACDSGTFSREPL